MRAQPVPDIMDIYALKGRHFPTHGHHWHLGPFYWVDVPV